MSRLDDFLSAAESGALRQDANHNEVAELAALVRAERVRTYRRACLAAADHHNAASLLACEHGALLLDLGEAEEAQSKARRCARHAAARDRIVRVLDGKPAFGGGQ